MSTAKRSTFMTLGEFLDRTQAYCLEARQAAEREAARSPEPINLGWREIASGEERLATLLARFIEMAPTKLRDTQLQYTPPEVAFPDTASPEATADSVLSMNHALTASLEQVATMLSAESNAELVSDLQAEIEAVGRQISMTRVTMRDGGA